MKILLSPAKDMKTLATKAQLEGSCQSDCRLNRGAGMQNCSTAYDEHRHVCEVYNCLRGLTAPEMGALFGIRGKTLEQTFSYYRKVYSPCSAGTLYHGLAFRALDYGGLAAESKAYLDKHLLILSALYGPLSPQQKICPYRLDFSTSLRKYGLDLTSSWQQTWGNLLAAEDYIFNLASQEFSSLFSHEKEKRLAANTWIDFAFYERDAESGREKQHATISKKGRGALARAMALAEVKQPEELKTLCADGFVFDPQHSTAQQFRFVRPAVL